jgi:phenylpyruvate tautomerase PptA (4-oxalocrotonate tautomerase family)
MMVAELPVVQVSVWAGISKENKKKVVEGMTRVLEELGNWWTVTFREVRKPLESIDVSRKR